MSTRMTIGQFFEHCKSKAINGYTLREGQIAPETYDELVLFMTERVGLVEIHDASLGIEALHHWILDNRTMPDSCSPEIDTEHVSTVILIGELKNRDEYVAQLPVDEVALALPPLDIVRSLIESQG